MRQPRKSQGRDAGPPVPAQQDRGPEPLDGVDDARRDETGRHPAAALDHQTRYTRARSGCPGRRRWSGGPWRRRHPDDLGLADRDAARASSGSACPGPTSRANGGVRSRLSSTTRSGLRCAVSPSGSRTVSRGSSASTVSTPTRTASCAARSRWPCSRAPRAR